MLIRFAPEDLQLFHGASHDANPLHLSAEYARTTAYGEPVVFGILGAMAAAGCLQEHPERVLREAELEFCNPLYVGVEYRVEVRKDSDDEAFILIYDANRLMAKSRYWFRAHRAEIARPTVAGTVIPSEAAVWSKADLRPGTEVVGKYSAEFNHVDRLAKRWSLGSKGFGWEQLTALLWSSYFVGMQLPGREATFWKARIEFHSLPEWDGEIEYKAQLQRLDERFDLLEMGAQLVSGGQALAAAKLWAFLRPESPQCSLMTLQDRLPGNRKLSGKVALVVGGSRGLGSATALALALSGCTVYVIYQHARDQALRLQTLAASTSGEIKLAQGSAEDSEWCRELLDQINQRHGGLDILVCNACPSIQPLSFAPETMERFHRFVNRSLELVSVPMSVFLPSLEKRSGWNVIVSTESVRTAPPQWPHYFTAKCAVEGLAHWAAPQFKSTKFLVIRPPKLLTDQMNTPSGRQGATTVEIIAATLAKRLAGSVSGPLVEILETFGSDFSSAGDDSS